MSIQSIASDLESVGVSNKVVIAKEDKRQTWMEHLANRIGTPAPGKHFEISYQTGGYRLEIVKDPHGGSSDISPRLPAKQFELWLWAFLAGYRFSKFGAV